MTSSADSSASSSRGPLEGTSGAADVDASPPTPPGEAPRVGHSDLWITLIGIGKLLKATGLVIVGCITLSMLRTGGVERVQGWAFRMGLRPGNHWVDRALAAVSGTDRQRLREIGLATFVYAALFLTEGIGLLFHKRWAEYFTIVITGSFVPLELYETILHFSPGKLLALVLNVVAVAYLVWHLRRAKAAHLT